MPIHIGKSIKKVSDSTDIGATELARIIGTTRGNVNSIFKRESIDTELLFKISKALNFNFFNLYTEALDKTGNLAGSSDALNDQDKELDILREKVSAHEKNSMIQLKYIALLEEKLAAQGIEKKGSKKS